MRMVNTHSFFNISVDKAKGVNAILGQNEMALDMQSDALKHRSLYRATNPHDPKIKLLSGSHLDY